MTGQRPDPESETSRLERDPLVRSVRRHQQRIQRWENEGGPSVSRRLAQIGVLGWLIVVPMLIGVFAGRWMDRRFHSGLFWTAPLLMIGAAIGCWSAWKWIRNA